MLCNSLTNLTSAQLAFGSLAELELSAYEVLLRARSSLNFVSLEVIF